MEVRNLNTDLKPGNGSREIRCEGHCRIFLWSRPVMVKEVKETIKALNEGGLSILLVEHNVSVALGVADHVYILRNGSITFEGSPTDFSFDEFTKKIYLAG